MAMKNPARQQAHPSPWALGLLVISSAFAVVSVMLFSVEFSLI
jgi:hypothetical protein